jgi:hypothetical protein
MSETRDPIGCAAAEISKAFRYLGDLSYAVLPQDLAHSVGDLNKSLLACVRSAVDAQVEWIDARVAGGDRLREEWRQAGTGEQATEL